MSTTPPIGLRAPYPDFEEEEGEEESGKTSLGLGKRPFTYLGLTVWNKIPQDGVDGNVPSCTGKSGEGKPPKPPKEPKNTGRLVRIGIRYFSKDTQTTRQLNFGIEFGKSRSGVKFWTQNQLVSKKQRIYQLVNKKAETKPGDTPLSPIAEDERT